MWILFYYFSSQSLKFQITKNILHGIQELMKLFFPNLAIILGDIQHLGLLLFLVFSGHSLSYSVAFVLRTDTLEIDKT